MKGKAIIMPWK